MNTHDKKTALKAMRDAIAFAGTQKKLAKALGVKQQAVWRWSIEGAPPRRVRPIELLTGVGRARLRPDLYG